MSHPSEKISAVIAVRNAATTLPRAVRSLAQQTLPPHEILLVLNGCTDASPQVAADLAQTFPSAHILASSTAGGVAEAAQLGCTQAAHPLIARMDADDESHPDRLAAQLQALQTHQADLVTCHVESQQSLGEGLPRYVTWANSLTQPADFRRERFIESPVIQPGVLMKKDCYLAAGGYRVEKGPEDYDLWLRLLEGGARLVQAPEAKLAWFDSATRLTRSHDDYSLAEMTRTKARYLARLPLIREEGVVLAGSGPIGRRLAKLLLAQRVLVHGFFDVAPRKIGKTALSLPIWGISQCGQRNPQAVLLACVGRGGRTRVRQLAQETGYREGENFFACC